MNNNNLNKKNQPEVMSNNLKNIMMYYHTAYRNIGLFTTLSITLFTFSLFFKKKDNLVMTTILHLISISSLVFASFIGKYTQLDMNSFKGNYNKNTDSEDLTYIEKWSNLLKYTFYFDIILILIFIYVIFNDLIKLNKKYKLFKSKK